MNLLFSLTIASLTLSLALAQSSQRELHQEKWNDYIKEYKKKYKDDKEETVRYNTFLNNLYLIEQHNKRFKRGEEDYELGLNEYADLYYAEFLMKKTGFNGAKLDTNLSNKNNEFLLDVFLTPYGKSKLDLALEACPTSINWMETTPAVLPPVKNQGSCGSCWAFSAATTMEARNAIKNGNLVSISEQNLVDCTPGCNCKGGWMDNAFTYVQDNGGVSTDAAYVYTATTSTTCKYSEANKAALVVTGFTKVSSGNEAALQAAVCTGPVAVAVCATTNFQLYKSGVFKDQKKCTARNLNHAVVAVGYGTVSGKSVWIIVNSWGESWGMNGYGYIARNSNNMCGIASVASYPIIG